MGDDWDDWATSVTSSTQHADSNTKIFANQYILPNINYMKTETIDRYFYVYLNDGSHFYIYQGDCLDIGYDVNGWKKPNEYGRDIFVFLYCPNIAKNYIKGKIVPHPGKESKNRQEALSRCKTYPKECATILSMDGWEFKDDYPYKI